MLKCFFRKTLAKMRLGSADLGNHSSPPINICPACKVGPNCESHLVFRCSAIDHLRFLMKDSIDLCKFESRFPGKSDDELLKLFLGDDLFGSKVLHERGEYINVLLQQHVECKAAVH